VFKKFLFIIIAYSFISSSLHATSTDVVGKDAWSDFKTSFKWLFKGSIKQFTTKNNLFYAGAAVPTLWYTFENDDRFTESAKEKPMKKHIELTGDLGVLLSFPILHSAFYIYGRSTHNRHHIQFAMEYMSSMYLALGESGLLSFIPIHERPDQENLTKWETGFRGNSSFPSGHVIPYYGLFFKTLQFYGPYWAIAPGVLSVWAAMQRVRSGRHYTSDVVGSFFLMAFASEGVREVAGYDKNHPFYKWVFEHDGRLSVIQHEGVYGPSVVWNY
jgi:undecaprenyl-diphosphatase